MLAGIIVAIVILIIGTTFFHLEHQTRKVKIILILAIGALLTLSIWGVFNSKNINLDSPSGIFNAISVYISWIGKTIAGIWEVGVKATGEVIKVVKFE